MPSTTVLIVDDFDRLRELVCLTLQQRVEFHVVGQASDGLDAVRQAQELQPDLILLDIGLPNLNGIEAGRRIRLLSPGSKILFLSQESSEVAVQEALALGAHGYLLKSDIGYELLTAVDTVCRGHQFISSHLRSSFYIHEDRIASRLPTEGLPYPEVARAVYPQSDMTQAGAWRVSGTYFEACNCEAICPCRSQGGKQLTIGSTYGFCDFALSWHIVNGTFARVDLSGRSVVMAGSYRDDEPNQPWRVILYVDERCSDEQFAVLTDIFLGRAGGTAFQNFGARIGAIYAVRRAAIELDHRPGRWFVRASKWLEVRAARMAPSQLDVTGGVPGHEQRGNELLTDELRVHDAPLEFALRGRCGFESRFDYSSQPGV